MGEIIEFPIRIRPTDLWQYFEPWAKDGHWQSCLDCRRAECFRSGRSYVACEGHSANSRPPAPYDYTPGAWPEE